MPKGQYNRKKKFTKKAPVDIDVTDHSTVRRKSRTENLEDRNRALSDTILKLRQEANEKIQEYARIEQRSARLQLELMQTAAQRNVMAAALADAQRRIMNLRNQAGAQDHTMEHLVAQERSETKNCHMPLTDYAANNL